MGGDGRASPLGDQIVIGRLRSKSPAVLIGWVVVWLVAAMAISALSPGNKPVQRLFYTAWAIVTVGMLLRLRASVLGIFAGFYTAFYCWASTASDDRGIEVALIAGAILGTLIGWFVDEMTELRARKPLAIGDNKRRDA